MKVLLNYNFNPQDVEHEDFAKVYEVKRRNACFAFVYQQGNYVYALRDHLGIVPLYYRFSSKEIKFGLDISSLTNPKDSISKIGLKSLIAFGTCRLSSLVKEISIIPPGTVVCFDLKKRSQKVVYRYTLKPLPIPSFITRRKLIDQADKLFMQAIQRLVKEPVVGLYLSGGIDSGLIGIYLNKLGVKVNAYTSAPWGKTSTEIPFAKTNAKAINVQKHYINYLETGDYEKVFDNIPQLYGAPHGTAASIEIANIWRDTPIATEKQMFFGQNSDTMLCTMMAQYLSLFGTFIPKVVRKKLFHFQNHHTLAENYLSVVSYGLFSDLKKLMAYCPSKAYSKIHELSLLGMFVGHTPSDSEVLSQPAILNSTLVSNPYDDVDLIEFSLGIPLGYRIGISKELPYVKLDKLVLIALAERYLPKELVHRKKALIVSFERDERTAKIASMLPVDFAGYCLKDNDQRFAAEMFLRWCKQNNIKFQTT